MTNKRIGIFSGIFDPIHKGHIGFALDALKKAKLDEVYLLVEGQPRRKTGVTHLSHRLAMAKLATAHYPKIKVLELPDRQFSVAKTLPRLQKKFDGSQLVVLLGSDSLNHLPDWPLVNRLLEQTELFIALRQDMSQPQVKKLLAQLPVKPNMKLVISPSPTVSSAQIRQAIQDGKTTNVLPSIHGYIKQQWLYAVPSASSSASGTDSRSSS